MHYSERKSSINSWGYPRCVKVTFLLFLFFFLIRVKFEAISLSFVAFFLNLDLKYIERNGRSWFIVISSFLYCFWSLLRCLWCCLCTAIWKKNSSQNWIVEYLCPGWRPVHIVPVPVCGFLLRLSLIIVGKTSQHLFFCHIDVVL